MKHKLIILMILLATISQFGFAGTRIFPEGKEKIAIGFESKHLVGGGIVVKKDFGRVVSGTILVMAYENGITLGTEGTARIAKHKYGELYGYADVLYTGYKSGNKRSSQLFTSIGFGIESASMFLNNWEPPSMDESPLTTTIEFGVTKPWTEDYDIPYSISKKPDFDILTTVSFGIHYSF